MSQSDSNTPSEPDEWTYTEERVDPDDVLVPARYRNRYRTALITIEDFAAELEGRHTGFVHIGRMCRIALRDYDKGKRDA